MLLIPIHKRVQQHMFISGYLSRAVVIFVQPQQKIKDSHFIRALYFLANLTQCELVSLFFKLAVGLP